MRRREEKYRRVKGRRGGESSPERWAAGPWSMEKLAMNRTLPRVKHMANFWGRRAREGRPTMKPRAKKRALQSRQVTKRRNRVA